MGRYILTEPAKADVREIIAYVRQRNPAAARRLRTRLFSAISMLADFPGTGHLREDVTDEPLRF